MSRREGNFCQWGSRCVGPSVFVFNKEGQWALWSFDKNYVNDLVNLEVFRKWIDSVLWGKTKW